MKKSSALIFAASTLLLAGCCTGGHEHATARWEYKVAATPRPPSGGGTPSPQEWREREQSFLNELGKEGWVLISQNEGRVFYLKRPIE